MEISQNFERSEFSCKCGCGQDTVDAELLLVLEAVRDQFTMPVKINSGNRCKKHNKKIGGSKNSQHIKGKAADIVVYGVLPEIVANWLDQTYPDKYGIGFYENFTHIDVRAEKARF